MSPARDERRQAVLGLLAHHGAVQWHDRGQDVAFADAVLELAARLGRVDALMTTTRPLRAARVAFGRGASGTGAPLSDEQGVSGVPGHPRDGGEALRGE